MDVEGLAQAIWNQFVTVWNAPVPFIAAVLLSAYIIWRLVRWQYGVQVSHLQSQIELYRESTSVQAIVSASSKRSSEADANRPSFSGAPRRRERPDITDEAADPTERVFMDQGITIRMLRGLMEKGTTLEGQAMAEPYIGKWMRLSGRVENVMEGGGDMILVSVADEEKEGFSIPTTNLFFQSNPQVRQLRHGQKVSAIGRLEAINPISIQFWDCELAP